jgi:hypothetical protein
MPITQKSLAKLWTKRVKVLSPNFLTENGILVWNSPGNEARFREFLEQRASTFSGAIPKRGELYQLAKTLGWTTAWNSSKRTELANYVQDQRSDLSLPRWRENFELLTTNRAPLSTLQLSDLKTSMADGIPYTLDIGIAGKPIKKIPFVDLNDAQIDSILSNYYVPDYRMKEDGSDKIESMLVEGIESLTIEPIPRLLAGTRTVGGDVGSWLFYNESGLPLEQNQMYVEGEHHDHENCLISTLRHLGVKETKLTAIKYGIGAMNIDTIPESAIKKITDIIKRPIMIKKLITDKFNVNSRVIGKDHPGEPLVIAIHKHHAFPYVEETPYTRFFLKNIEELKSIDGISKYKYTERRGKSNKFRSKPTKGVNSLLMVKLLCDHNQFTKYRPMGDLTHDSFEAIPSLEDLEEEQRLFMPKDCLEEKKQIIYYADFECATNSETHRRHEGIMVSYCCEDDDDSDVKCLRVRKGDCKDPDQWEKRFMRRFSDELYDDVWSRISPNNPKDYQIIVYFHNAKYDHSIFSKHWFQIGSCEGDGNLYSAKFSFTGSERHGKRITIEVRDSLKFLNMSLKAIPKAMGLETQKGEAIAYNFHNHQNIQCREEILIQEYVDALRSGQTVDKADELEDIFRAIMKGKKTFNSSDYYAEYCILDVKVLRDGLRAFSKLIMDETGLVATRFLTISSIAHQFASNKGCYSMCYETTGNTREYIQASVRGGKVMATKAHRMKRINKVLQDFDGISMYPSAMTREHASKGEIKRGGRESLDFYRSKTHYIVTVKITKINRVLQVPLVCVKNTKGVISYLNEVPEGGVTIILDRIALEDYIKYAEIEFEIEDGIYWNAGTNNGLAKIMNQLHKTRSECKKANPARGNVLKLLMNSTFGKTIQKRHNEETVFKKGDNYLGYVHSNFGQLKSIEEVGCKQIKIVRRKYDAGFSLNHIGGLILSTAKRIMNEVFGIMEDEKMNIYYTDTDSIHMEEDDIKKLKDVFQETYGRELEGEKLGQFHKDFDFKGHRDVVSIRSYFLASKVYCDLLRGVHVETGDVHYTSHYRTKGIRMCGVENELSERFEQSGQEDKPDEYTLEAQEPLMKLFDDMSEEIPIDFVLNPDEGHISFDVSHSGTSTRAVGTFKRCYKFTK